VTDPSRPPTGARPITRIGRSHGLAGAFRVHPESDDAAAVLAAAEQVWIDGLGEARVLSFVPHGRDWLLRVDRVRRVELAKRLVHAHVHAVAPAGGGDAGAGAGDDAARPEAAVGRPVRVDGRPYGEVVALEGTPLQPLLRVRGPDGERFLPVAAPYVRVGEDGVDVDDPPAGLLDAT
jgi:hypothetical protein